MPDVKTFHEYFKIKQQQQETVMRELRETQRHIKDNSENYSNQMKIFKDLRYLLEAKSRTAANGGDGLVGYQDTQARGFDRFVVREWNWKSNWYYNDEEMGLTLPFMHKIVQASAEVGLSSGNSSVRELIGLKRVYFRSFSPY